jgi:hypothetical protein|tara:strand:- start:446 stop:1450 length:1005 start_codon:yes stop_codon:yes gene_type:complete
MNKNILILKNDRTGDLFVSLKAINRILVKHKSDKIIIFLSNINHKFDFLFSNIKKKIISMDLNFYEKISIIKFLIFNNVETVYILTPKNFYYYLPFFFRKIKFYAITIKNQTNRPKNYLLKYLYKYVTINRLEIKKRNSSYNIQESLIEFINETNLINLKLNIDNNFIYPKNYLFFHYKHNLFSNLLGWSLYDIDNLLIFFEKKNINVMFSSELNNKVINDHFLKKYNSFDFNNNTKKTINKNGIFFLKDVEGQQLFDLVKKANIVVAPEGIITHIAYFLKRPILALLHFNLNNKQDFINQIISCKEWFPPSEYKFTVLKKDFKKSINKLDKRI